jgi:hypothetical protein
MRDSRPNRAEMTSLPLCRCWVCRQRSVGHVTVHRLARTRAEAAAHPQRGWPCLSCGEWIVGTSGEERPTCARCVRRHRPAGSLGAEVAFAMPRQAGPDDASNGYQELASQGALN